MTILRSFSPITKQTFSNIEQGSIQAWTLGASYNIGDLVTHNTFVWKSTKDANTDEPVDGSLSWVKEYSDNQHAYSDPYPTTASTNVLDSIILEFDSNDTDIISLQNMYGSDLIVTITEKGTGIVKYSNTIQLSEYDEPQDIYDYFFLWGDVRQKRDVLINLDKYYNCTLRIEITRKDKDGTLTSELGFLDFGQKKNLGCTLAESLKISNKSDKEITYIDGRAISDVFTGTSIYSLDVWIEDVMNTKTILDELNKFKGKNLVIIGDDTGYNPIYTIVGIYQDTEFSVGYDSRYSISIHKIEKE